MPKLNTHTTKCYRLKHILDSAKLSHRKIAEHLPISASAFYQLIAYQRWPASVPQAELKAQIASALLLFNIPTNGDLWDLVQKNSPFRRGVRGDVLCAPIPRARIENNGKHLQLTQLELNILRRPSMLTNEIIDYLKLQFDPFREELRSDRDVLNITEQQRILKMMHETADRQEFIGIFGDVGSGKTTMKTIFKMQLEEKSEIYRVSEPAIIEKDKCTASTITDAMLLDWHYTAGTELNKAFGRNRRALEFRTRLLRQQLLFMKENSKKPVLILDDAHRLPDEAIKSLKLFWEIRSGFKGILAIIMIGQTELPDRINRFNMREVGARVRMVEMKAIPNALEKYITHKIEMAGGTIEHIISKEALSKLKQLYRDERKHLIRPALINNIVRVAINEAYNTGKQFPLSAEIMEIAHAQLEGTPKVRTNRGE